MRPPRNDRDRQRPSRRRGFDDDNFFGNAPPPVPFPSFAASASGPEMEATVKWFNAEKGYGFVALSDVRASHGRLRAITLPARLQPSVLYKAAVVRGTEHEAQARAFVEGLRGPAGRGALQDAGFRVP